MFGFKLFGPLNKQSARNRLRAFAADCELPGKLRILPSWPHFQVPHDCIRTYIYIYTHIDPRSLRSRLMLAQNLTIPFTEVHGTKVWSTWTHTVLLFGCSMFRIFPGFLAHLQASMPYGQTTQTSNRKPQKYRALLIISGIQRNSYKLERWRMLQQS